MARVLIIEDSASQAQIMAEIVTNAGHQATLCNDLGKGIAQILKATDPQVVLLDLILLGPDGKPVADGFQMCREIKRISGKRIGVVVVSSKDDEASAEWAMLQGADAFLQKPFVVDDLLDVLGQVLGG